MVALRALLLVAFLGALSPGTVLRTFAAELEVSPVHFAFGAGSRTSLLHLRNQGPGKVLMQIRAYRWSQTAKGADRYSETDEILFFPRIFELAAGERRAVRIAARAATTDREQSYRLFVEELPENPMRDEPGVQTLLRMGIPVFVSPRETAPASRIEVAGIEHGHLSFRFRNQGNVHFVAPDIRISGHDSAGREIFAERRDGWYVLPGAGVPYEIGIPARHCDSLRRLEISITTNRAPVRESLTVDPDSCSS